MMKKLAAILSLPVFLAGCFGGEEVTDLVLTEDQFVELAAAGLCLPTENPDLFAEEIRMTASELLIAVGVDQGEFNTLKSEIENDTERKSAVGSKIVLARDTRCGAGMQPVSRTRSNAAADVVSAAEEAESVEPAAEVEMSARMEDEEVVENAEITETMPEIEEAAAAEIAQPEAEETEESAAEAEEKVATKKYGPVTADEFQAFVDSLLAEENAAKEEATAELENLTFE